MSKNVHGSSMQTVVNAVSQRHLTTQKNLPSDLLPAPILRLIELGRYAEASERLQKLPRSPLILETLGVCLMRSNQNALAVNLFRRLALNPGTTVIRMDASDGLRVNFATAILLHGSPSGALDILQDLQDRDCLPAVRMKAAIQRWAKGLSFWRRLDWKWNRIEPANTQVPIDFELGEFPFTIGQAKLASELPSDGKPPKRTAPKLAA
tara:strand:- start:80 stop:703 length:624 start_codon:yes stop_codon:yes gene_type:complete